MSYEQELQDLLNRSVAHVRKQGKPSVSGKDSLCRYRGPDGLQCAAGPFITEYVPSMEEKRFGAVANDHPDKVDPVARKHPDFVSWALQDSHDEAALYLEIFMEKYEERLRSNVNGWNAANKTNLVVPELQS